MADVKIDSIVEIECLLKNGREIFLVLELPRDLIREDEQAVIVIRNPEDGTSEESRIPASEVAYMKLRTIKAGKPSSPYRTLGTGQLVQSS